MAKVWAPKTIVVQEAQIWRNSHW